MFRPKPIAQPGFPASLWRDGNFLRLWAAQAVSSFGRLITRDGLPLAAVLTIHAGPQELGVLGALAAGPSFIVGLFAGSFVDRSRRRSILIAADIFRAGILMIVPIAAWLNLLSIMELFIAAALVGAASALFDIADKAYLPTLIERRQLVEGNSKLSTTDALAEIGGPAIAGILFQLLTAPIAIAVNAATYLVSAAFLGTIDKSESAVAGPLSAPHWWEDFKFGAQAVFGDAILRPLLLMAMTAAFFGAFFLALYTFFAITELGLTPGMLGLTVATGGVGALLGAVIAPRAAERFGVGPIILVASFGFGAAQTVVPFAGGSPAFAMAILMAAQLIGDSLFVVASVSGLSLRQAILPVDVLGRAGAVFHAGSGAVAVLGALVGGILGAALGARSTLLIAALGMAAAPLWAVASPLWRLRTIPAD